MTKKQLCEATAIYSDTDVKDVEFIVDAFLENLKRAQAEGHEIFMRGFGTFFIRTRKPKTARNILKGTTMLLPATNQVSFKPAPVYKNMVKKSIKQTITK